MGYGKILGLGNFDVRYSAGYSLIYKGHGQIITLSKTSVTEDIWARIIANRQIKFIIHGSSGENGSSTPEANGGLGGFGSKSTIIETVRDSNDVFQIHLGGESGDALGRGGAGGEAPLKDGKETKGKNGNYTGGGGGCSGESFRYNDYGITRYLRGGSGGTGGHGCSVYLIRDGVTTLLGAAFGGGGGGGGSAKVNSWYVDGDGGKAGTNGYMINGVPQPGTGGQRAREDNVANGQNATSPTSYTENRNYTVAAVYAPLWY